MTVLLHSDGLEPDRDVLVFGSGAIGSAVVRSLRRRRTFSTLTWRIPWTESDRRAQVLQDMTSALHERGRHRPLSLVWTAGKAGFGASEADAEHEFAAYADVVRVFQQLQAGSDHPHTFHLLSSAGGLYEGRAVRSAEDPPTPRRSYGRLKLRQEHHAVAELGDSSVSIYRPSSVFSVPRAGERVGLITALVRNGLTQSPTTIVGALDTLRDYVLAADIGSFVAEQALRTPPPRTNMHMLVNGHPASILQVITAVESVLRRRLYIRVADAWNASNITFSPASKARGFQSTPLRVGIAMVHAAFLGQPRSA